MPLRVAAQERPGRGPLLTLRDQRRGRIPSSGLFPSDVALTAEAKDKVNFVAESWAFSAVSIYLRNPYTGMCVSSFV